jgi:hypothetical protein
MREAGRGSGEAGGGKREAGRGRGGPVPFAGVMREQGMCAPAALEQALRRAEGHSVEEILKSAEELLDRVLTAECEARESALDLLTVDALVTRAMEIAARDPDSLAKFPELAMRRITAR